MVENTEIRAVSAPWYNGVNLLIRRGDTVGVGVTMEARNPGEFVEPTLRIGRAEAQILMDDLWNAGLRPTEGSGSAGSLRATEKHLEDMRKIAFKNIGIEG